MSIAVFYVAALLGLQFLPAVALVLAANVVAFVVYWSLSAYEEALENGAVKKDP